MKTEPSADPKVHEEYMLLCRQTVRMLFGSVAGYHTALTERCAYDCWIFKPSPGVDVEIRFCEGSAGIAVVTAFQVSTFGRDTHDFGADPALRALGFSPAVCLVTQRSQAGAVHVLDTWLIGTLKQMEADARLLLSTIQREIRQREVKRHGELTAPREAEKQEADLRASLES